MAFVKSRHYNKNPQRRKIPGVGAEERRTRHRPLTITSITANIIDPTRPTVLFAEVPIVSGVVPGWTMGAETAIAVERVTDTQWRVVFSGAIVATDEIVIPFEDLAFRNSAGGYVNQQTIEVA